MRPLSGPEAQLRAGTDARAASRLELLLDVKADGLGVERERRVVEILDTNEPVEFAGFTWRIGVHAVAVPLEGRADGVSAAREDIALLAGRSASLHATRLDHALGIDPVVRDHRTLSGLALRACLAGFTLRSVLSGLALGTLWTHRALVTLGSRGTLGADLPGVTCEAPEASRTDLPGVTLGSLDTLGAGLTRLALGTWLALYAGVTLGTGIASDALGTLCASLTLRPDLASYPLGTWFALRALRPDLAGFARESWFAGRSASTWRPYRPDRTRLAL